MTDPQAQPRPPFRSPDRGVRLKRTLAAAFGALGLAGITFLVVGVVLARPWTAERAVTIAAPPQDVFAYVDSLALWDRWTVWADVPSTTEGPGRGLGARRTWDDPTYGSGSFVIRESVAPERLAYDVEVEGGAMTIQGQFRLEALNGGTSTRMVWSEQGDFGRNPLLGYMAGSMGRSQGEEMDRSLATLKELLEDPAGR